MRSRPLLVLASCLGLLMVFASTSDAKPKVAVLGLEVTGDSAMDPKATEAAKALTRELRREAGRPDGLFELAPNSNKDLLEMKLLSDCGDEGKRCMSEIGKQLKAERLVYGKLERTKRGYAVTLRLLDTESSELLKQLNETITTADITGSSGLQPRARSFYASLTGADAEGAISIVANAERGTVYIDGQIRTTLSAGSARVSGVTPGVHAVAIDAPGFERFEREVNVDPGETRNLNARLILATTDGDDDGAERPGGGWRVAFWSGMIVTGVAGAGWTYTGLSVQREEKETTDAGRALERMGVEYDRPPEADERLSYCDAYRDQASVQDNCDSGKNYAKLTNILWPATAVAALFTGYAFYKGYIAPPSSSEREARRRGKRPGKRITVAPALGPNLVGAGLELQF